MALGTYDPEAARAARAVRIAVIALVAVVIALAALFASGRLGTRDVAAEDLTRVLLVGAATDETGDVVAQIIAVADVSGASSTLTAVSPATAVTLPGTTYDTIADAYPFGGGAGVAAALARIEDTDPLPYVALDARALAAALEREGSVTLELPAAMSVFDGEELFTLSPGTRSLKPAELTAVFKGAPYLSATARTRLDAELASLLSSLIAATEYEAVDTNLTADAYTALQSALGTVR